VDAVSRQTARRARVARDPSLARWASRLVMGKVSDFAFESCDSGFDVYCGALSFRSAMPSAPKGGKPGVLYPIWGWK
jgi:hypothetical protein